MKFLYREIVKDDGKILRGVINTPDNYDEDKEYPTLIMFHGLGGDRNGSGWFRTANAKYFCDRDFIVARFDFSGSGESDGDFYDMTLERELEEARMIHAYVKNLKASDDSKIYWYGHSLGGVICSLLAKDLNPKALTLLAPASDINNPSYLLRNFGQLAKGIDPDLDYRDLDNRKKLDEAIEIDDIDLDGVKISKDFFVNMMQYDIYASAKQYDGPVQILRGTEDELVEKVSNEKLNKAFKNSTFEEIEAADHSFKIADGRKIVFEKMYQFISEN